MGILSAMKMNGKQINAVLFDMDGILFNSESVYAKCFHEAAKMEGLPCPDDWYMKNGCGTRYEEMMAKIRVLWADFSEEKIKKFVELDDKLVLNMVRDSGMPIKEGVLETLNFLKGKVKMAVVSSSTSSWVKMLLEKAKIEKFFDLIIGGEMVEKPKPDPACYLTAIRQFNVQPENVLVFEDSWQGILAAKGSGSIVIHVPDAQEIPKEILQKTDFIFRQMNEVFTYLQ